MSHQPFSSGIKNKSHVLQKDDIAMVDDAKMTEDDSNKLMFNLLRVLVFKPVSLTMFLQKCINPLRDLGILLDSTGAAHYVLTYEIIETSSNVVSSFRYMPIVSRFSELSELYQFVADNRLLMMPPNTYQIRICLSHYVADCFIYIVRGPHLTENKKSAKVTSPNRVDIEQMNSFACGPVQGRLGAKTVGGRAQNILTCIPSRLRSNTPGRLWYLDGDASLYWLPTLDQILNPKVEIPQLMREAYWFHPGGDNELAFMSPDNNKSNNTKSLEERVAILELGQK